LANFSKYKRHYKNESQGNRSEVMETLSDLWKASPINQQTQSERKGESVNEHLLTPCGTNYMTQKDLKETTMKTNPTEVKLLTCPFCGSYNPLQMGNMYDERYWFHCTSCKCDAPKYRTLPEAIDGWNTRTTPPSTTEEACAKVREEANNWTPEFRAFLFKKGMEIVNAGNSQPWHKAAIEEISRRFRIIQFSGEQKTLLEQILLRHSTEANWELVEDKNRMQLLIADLEWSASVFTETMTVKACPCCYGWHPNSGKSEFWNGRESRRGHNPDCAIKAAMNNAKL
jgi:hypothetical protein